MLEVKIKKLETIKSYVRGSAMWHRSQGESFIPRNRFRWMAFMFRLNTCEVKRYEEDGIQTFVILSLEWTEKTPHGTKRHEDKQRRV